MQRRSEAEVACVVNKCKKRGVTPESLPNLEKRKLVNKSAREIKARRSSGQQCKASALGSKGRQLRTKTRAKTGRLAPCRPLPIKLPRASQFRTHLTHPPTTPSRYQQSICSLLVSRSVVQYRTCERGVDGVVVLPPGEDSHLKMVVLPPGGSSHLTLTYSGRLRGCEGRRALPNALQ